MSKTGGFQSVLVMFTLLWCLPAHANEEEAPRSLELLKEAKVLAEKQLRKGLLAKVLPDIALTQARAGDREAARETFQQTLGLVASMKEDATGGLGTVELLADIAAIQGMAGMREDMRAIFAEALRRAEKVSDLRSRLLAYQKIAVGQAKGNERTGAQRTLKQLFAAGMVAETQRSLSLDEIRYLRLQGAIKVSEAYWEAADHQLAEEILERVLQMLRDFSPGDSSNSFYFHSLREIAHLQAKIGKAQLAEATLQNLYERSRNHSERIQATLSVVAGFIEAKENELADHYLEVAAQMTGNLAFDDPRLQSAVLQQIWEEIALAKAQLGNWKEAVQTSAKISVDWVKSHESAYRIIAQLRDHDWEGIVRTIHNWERDEIDLELLAEVVVAQSQAGKVNDAVETFDLLAQLVRTSEKMTRHKATFSTSEQHPTFLRAVRAIAAARAATGDVKGALAWTRRQESPDEKVYALLGVAEGMI